MSCSSRLRRLTAPTRRPRAGACRILAAAALVVVAAACTSDPGAEASGATPPVRVASAPDGEGALLAQVMIALLDAEDIATERAEFSDAGDARQALELGRVDLRVGYTGEAWLETLGRADPPGDPRASFGPVRTQDATQGITWLEPEFGEPGSGLPANATFAFVVPDDIADATELRTVSQLAARLEEQPDAGVCVDREFGTRDDGLRAVLDAYGVRSDRPFLAATPEEAVIAVAAGDCLAGLTTATDGAAWAAGLRPLIDDLQVFPAFVVAAQVRTEVLAEQPAVGDALAPMATALTTGRLGGWNAQVAAGVPVEDGAVEAATTLRAAAEAAAGEEAEGSAEPAG